MVLMGSYQVLPVLVDGLVDSLHQRERWHEGVGLTVPIHLAPM